MKSYIPEKIYIDDRALEYPLTKSIIEKFPKTTKITVKNTNTFIKSANKTITVSEGKRSLFLTINKGKFLKKCPGTKNYICCGYQILHQMSQCNIDCSYCILQSYFNNPLLTVYVNLNDMFSELKDKISLNPKKLFRIGTGEFTDSLILDNITDFSKKILPFFIKQPNAILELKTKTIHIDNLLQFKPKGKIVAAWSLNTERIQENEEHFSANIKERIKAAKKCERRGYKTAFHFDPIIYYKGWKKEYLSVIDMIFKNISPSSIAWISMGTFRFMPHLKNIIENRFPNTSFIYEEFAEGLDGKMRYLKPVRIEIYKALYNRIRKYSDSVFVYLCMESSEIWKEAFGFTPKKFGTLSKGLDKQVFPI